MIMMRPSLPISSPTLTAWPTLSRITTPSPRTSTTPLPPLMAVQLAAFRRAAAEKELAEAIHAAATHISWREVGEAIGTSGEAARQRYAS